MSFSSWVILGQIQKHKFAFWQLMAGFNVTWLRGVHEDLSCLQRLSA
jgi:hypothetical protein